MALSNQLSMFSSRALLSTHTGCRQGLACHQAHFCQQYPYIRLRLQINLSVLPLHLSLLSLISNYVFLSFYIFWSLTISTSVSKCFPTVNSLLYFPLCHLWSISKLPFIAPSQHPMHRSLHF